MCGNSGRKPRNAPWGAVVPFRLHPSVCNREEEEDGKSRRPGALDVGWGALSMDIPSFLDHVREQAKTLWPCLMAPAPDFVHPLCCWEVSRPIFSGAMNVFFGGGYASQKMEVVVSLPTLGPPVVPCDSFVGGGFPS